MTVSKPSRAAALSTLLAVLVTVGLAAEDFPDAKQLPPLGSAIARMGADKPFGLMRGMNIQTAFRLLCPDFDADSDADPVLDERYWPFTTVDFYRLPNATLSSILLSTDWIREGEPPAAQQIYMAVKTKLTALLGAPSIDELAQLRADEDLSSMVLKKQTIWASLWRDGQGNLLAVESYQATGDATGYINLEIWPQIPIGKRD